MKTSIQIGPLIGGMNAASPAHLLPETQFCRGINISVRGGHAHTRPGWHLVSDKLCEAINGGLFQGGVAWNTPDGVRLVLAFAGQVYVVNPTTDDVIFIGPYMSKDLQVFMEQADRYLVIQDGVNILVLGWDEAPQVLKTNMIPETLMDDSWDESWAGVALVDKIDNYLETHSDSTFAEAVSVILAGLPTPSFPPATILKYAHGRLHVVSTRLKNRYFLSSDILLPTDPLSVLRWWENDYLNSGGGLGLPEELGEIRGMSVMKQSSNQASGQGALVVFAENGVAAFNVFLPRAGVFDIELSGDVTSASFVKPKMISAGWKDQQISQVLFSGGGTNSPWAIANVNGDLFYRSHDGWRLLRQTAEAAAGSVTANAPTSNEVRPFIEYDPAPSTWVSAAVRDHRLMMTAAGQPDRSHKGIVVLDTNALASLGQTPQQAFDGMWTGPQVVKLINTTDKLLAVCVDGSIYELTDSPWDHDGETSCRIESQLITKQLTPVAGKSSTEGLLKELEYVDLWLTDIQGDVDIEVFFRSDNHPYWTTMGEKQIKTSGPPQERRRLRFVVCQSEIRSVPTQEGPPLSQGEAFQFLLRWRGAMTLRRLTVSANLLSEPPPRLTSDPACATITLHPNQIIQDDFSYVLHV